VYISNAKKITAAGVDAPGAAKVTKKSLVGPGHGWKGWVMRLFTIAPGGHTPRHTHPWPHINYVVEGEGILYLGGKENLVEPGSVAYIPGGEEHQFMNRSRREFTFICIVPEEGDA